MENTTAANGQVGTGEPMIEVVRDGVHYTVLGTAHVSRTSAETVSELLAGGTYDAVAVELCKSRHQALTDENTWRKLDLFQIIRDGKVGLVMANLTLGAYQRRLAEQFGIEPGAEMKAAIQAAGDSGLSLQLIDRELGVTLKRVYRSLSFFKRMGLLSGLVASLISSEEISEEEIERLKQGDILENTFTEFALHSPEMYESLISERDEFMAARLRQENAGNPAWRVLVVIGAGHMSGLVRLLQSDQAGPQKTQDRLNTIPKAAAWPKLIPWLIMILVLGGFAYGFSQDRELGWDLVANWVIINGGLAALGALLAGGHPLTVISGLIAAPLTSLNPTIAAGMVTASVETWLRKPTVDDFEKLRHDVVYLRGWWRNGVARILLVFFLSNIGSIVGTWVAGFRIWDKLT